METRVLGITDPLVPVLTVRQMMFMAGVLEGGVAYALLCNRRAFRAPWLVLWLVGVFAAYRAGFWAVGFSGYCNCLGHIIGWIPGFEVWADRVMKASLAFMAAGCIWVLVERRRSGVGAMALSQRSGRSSWTSIILCCLAGHCLQARAQAAASNSIPPYEVRGTVTEELLYGETNVIARDCVCRVDGTRWNIGLVVTIVDRVGCRLGRQLSRAAGRAFEYGGPSSH